MAKFRELYLLTLLVMFQYEAQSAIIGGFHSNLEKTTRYIIVLYWEYSDDIHRSSKFMANVLLQKSNQH